MSGMRHVLEQAGRTGLVVPGVYDALTARLAAKAGFGAVYLSGASLSYTAFGRPDTGYTGLSDIEAAVRRISSVLSVPVLVDADHGFGSPVNVAVAVERIEAAGAAAIQIEDQVFPKKCGHLDGKAIIPAVEMGAKVAAAVEARNNPDTWIIARTDALAVEGIDAAIRRAAFYADCGADALFIEAPRDEADLRRIADRFASRIPLIANMVDGGRTPLLSAPELAEMGFDITLFPGATTRAVMHAVEGYFGELVRTGDIRTTADRLAGFEALNTLLGLSGDVSREKALKERMERSWNDKTPKD